jgi:hypothetical protein
MHKYKIFILVNWMVLLHTFKQLKPFTICTSSMVCAANRNKFFLFLFYLNMNNGKSLNSEWYQIL